MAFESQTQRGTNWVPLVSVRPLRLKIRGSLM